MYRITKCSRIPLFRTRLTRSPRYFEGRSNSLGITLMFSVIYYQLFWTRLFRISHYFELIVLSLHLKSTPLFWTCNNAWLTYSTCSAKNIQLCYSITKQNALLVNCSPCWNTHVWTLLSLFWSFNIVKYCSEFIFM